MTTDLQTDTSRSAALKAATHATHELLDRAIMTARPFASVENYARFLKVQHGFHRDVSPIYAAPAVAALIPDLARLCRFDAVTHDLVSLGQPVPGHAEAPACEGLELPEALGWLYVVEGSNLGGAFLFKAALKMGLDETRGASHLAGAPEGRAANWRAFKSALDGVELSAEEERRVIAGAEAAFARVQALVRQHMG